MTTLTRSSTSLTSTLADPGDPGGSPYHRLSTQQRGHRWWRPLLVGLAALGLYVAVLLVAVAVAIVVGLLDPAAGTAVDTWLQTPLDLATPTTVVVLLGSLGLMLPALLLATRLVGARPVGLLSSVAGRLRYRWLGVAMLLALAVWLPVVGVGVAVEAATGTLLVREVPAGRVWVLLVATVALVPVQAAAEEYVFRGYLGQLVGGWLRHPAFAVLLPVPVFVVGHDYDLFGSLDVAAFAVMCGWLAWRTGGLEAAIAVHVVNNVVLMSLAAVGIGDPNATGTDLVGLTTSLVTMAVFTVLVARRADALGLRRTRPPASA